ncbi:calmodulin-A-like [Hydractinia symbiolongicarpus]|uniref:calmodulin-A-like n=1 Tax=Hydractinia symbiolongicarpus TaxID=13093 RepID=UPI00255094BC|nr:calmodulin-A-like [Hydractinia symbiolongicarpus]
MFLHKIKSGFFNFLSRLFSSQDEQSFRGAFNNVDSDSDGHITLEEAIQAMSLCGIRPTQSEIQDMFTEKPGSLDFPDFLKLLYKRIKNVDDNSEMLQAFRMFDTEGNGTIKTTEFRNILLAINDQFQKEEIDEMLKDADPEKKGVIEYQKFIHKMKQS